MNHQHSEDKLVAKIDFRNAFNSIRRDKILSEVKEHTPSLYRMIWQPYSSQSYLYFGDKDLLYSMEGVQQGDPPWATAVLFGHQATYEKLHE